MSSEMRPYVVVAACIISRGYVLLHMRTHSTRNPSIIGKYELPGGIVNLGEDFREALKREVREELGLEIVVDDLLHSQSNTYDDGEDYLVLYYKCRLDSQYVLRGEFIWVMPREVQQFDTLPGTCETVAVAAQRGYIL